MQSLMNLDGGGIAEQQTANNIGGGSGLPNRVGGTTVQDSYQLASWMTANFNPGAEAYTDAQMWREYVSGPKWPQVSGVPLTLANYRQAAKQESQRLFDLGFTQVHDVENARLIYEGYARAAGDSFSYLPVTEETAQLQADVIEKYSWTYVIGGIGDSIGGIVKKAGDVADDLGETISNPLTLPAVAVIGVVGLILLAKFK